MAKSKSTLWREALAPNQKYGRWTLIEKAPRDGRGERWVCRCECGTVRSVRASYIFLGRSLSCGCLSSEQFGSRTRKHGLSGTPEYATWSRMVDRCTSTNNPKYKDYGGRGIRIADEWRHDPEAFIRHIGPRPSPQHSLDRINNDGHYEPGNVRWATVDVQANNTRQRKSPVHRFPPTDGERNARARLNNVAVRVVRFLAKRGVSVQRLAKAHGVCDQSIRNILTGKGWAQVGDRP